MWRHHDPARFWESDSGAGPRATPTLSGGRVYALGGSGFLNALDAGDGAVVWSRNAASDVDAKIPHWGFTSSPLVVDDLLIVNAAHALVAYDLATGDPRWFGPARGPTYSSPHRATIDGIEQIVMLGVGSATSVAPADGTLLWEHPWSGWSVVQPALTPAGDVLIGRINSAGLAIGMRRIAIAHGADG